MSDRQLQPEATGVCVNAALITESEPRKEEENTSAVLTRSHVAKSATGSNNRETSGIGNEGAAAGISTATAELAAHEGHLSSVHFTQ